MGFEMIQWTVLEMSTLKCLSLAASLFTTPNSLKTGRCADTLPGITNSHFPDLQHWSHPLLLPLCSPISACIFHILTSSPC